MNISKSFTRSNRFQQAYEIDALSQVKPISKRIGTAKSTVSRTMSASHSNLKTVLQRPHTSSFRSPTYGNIKPRLPSNSLRRHNRTFTNIEDRNELN